jgi:peptidoglycan hydrolase-like protein with peptidoglycan-binding domain
VTGPVGTARRRSGLVALGAAVVVVASVAVAGALGLGGRGPAAPQVPRGGGTVRVTRATLVKAASIDATLGHGSEVPVGLKATGTVTWLPAAGVTVNRGGTLLRVDDRPVALLYGDLPMYRRLGVDAGPAQADQPTGTAATGTGQTSTAPAVGGHDVQQFEANLKSLGYSGFTVDDTYTAQTAQAVKHWQKDLGLPQTGAVEVNDVVYATGPVRVARGLVRIGAPASGDVLSYTSTARMVTAKVPVSDTGWAAVGVGVDVVLPGGTTVAGAVAGVGTNAAAPPDSQGGAAGANSGEQTPTLSVTISIADQAALGTLDSSPVAVRRVVDKRENVLTVPVSALLALAEGGYGLEVVDGDGSSRFIAVQTGLFADGSVEVSGSDVAAGMKIRIP